MTTSPQPARGKRVLVVDDRIETAEGLTALLQVLGHEVSVVHDGRTALGAALAQPPDVVLLDIGLPDMDGCEVARRMRADQRMRATTLVALTGFAREDDEERARSAGFDHYVVKPVDPDALDALLSGAATVRAT